MAPEVKPGWKSTEFWLSLVVIAPWLAKSWGIDLGVDFPDDPEGLSVLVSAAQQDVIAATKRVGDAPAWVAGLYVLSRAVTKFKK